ncbi:MAG: cysteine--tRNA ligase [Spirochaetes bacterium GWF1_51_8]|nr:MAG: cysteine--tRNA ligase [Spirochaetes bacterium GWF1_51_8]
MPVRFYNTMTRELEDFTPLQQGTVTMYTCGPTVYNFLHIGNLRSFLFEDLLHRWLTYRGYNVRQIMNLTDIDDKTIKGSQAKKIPLAEYTEPYKKAFFDDLKTLNFTPAEKYPSATEHIPEMVAIIEKLIAGGYAYETDDGVYFKITSFAPYGKLAHLDRDSLRAGASGRVANDEYEKETVSDFALWKKWTPGDGDVKWDSPWGEGRPGWHIECSAMSMKYLGETLDIHTGGVDNMFPHHENEIAQSEAATGKPFVRYWLHAAHLVVEGEKMAKSKGNFYTLRDLLEKGYSPRSIRYLLYTTHYRKPLNFTFDGIKAADASLKRIDDFLFTLRNVKNSGEADSALTALLKTQTEKFEAGIDEDLNIAEGMGALFELIRAVNEKMESVTTALAGEIIAFFEKIETVLGFLSLGGPGELNEEDMELIAARTAAKKNKDFARADEIRKALLAKGIEVRDTPDGPVWKRI